MDEQQSQSELAKVPNSIPTADWSDPLEGFEKEQKRRLFKVSVIFFSRWRRIVDRKLARALARQHSRTRRPSCKSTRRAFSIGDPSATNLIALCPIISLGKI
jgi:hypothetical protein